MSRRSLIPLLIGIIGSIVGFTVVALLRQDRCADGGGTWTASTGTCIAAGGPINAAQASDLVAGMIVALLMVVVLHRVFTFAARSKRR